MEAMSEVGVDYNLTTGMLIMRGGCSTQIPADKREQNGTLNPDKRTLNPDAYRFIAL